MIPAQIKRVVSKPAGTILLDAKRDRSGTVFTTIRGGTGNTIWSLPPHSKHLKGYQYTFISLHGSFMYVATRVADTMATRNDMAADSMGFSTTAEVIGGVIHAFNDGQGWIVWVGSAGHTGSVGT